FRNPSILILRLVHCEKQSTSFLRTFRDFLGKPLSRQVRKRHCFAGSARFVLTQYVLEEEVCEDTGKPFSVIRQDQKKDGEADSHGSGSKMSGQDCSYR